MSADIETTIEQWEDKIQDCEGRFNDAIAEIKSKLDTLSNRNQDLSAIACHLTQDLEDALEDNAAIEDSRIETLEERDALRRDNEELQRQVESLQKQVQELSSKCDTLEDQRNELQVTLVDMETILAPPAPIFEPSTDDEPQGTSPEENFEENNRDISFKTHNKGYLEIKLLHLESGLAAQNHADGEAWTELLGMFTRHHVEINKTGGLRDIKGELLDVRFSKGRDYVVTDMSSSSGDIIMCHKSLKVWPKDGKIPMPSSELLQKFSQKPDMTWPKR